MRPFLDTVCASSNGHDLIRPRRRHLKDNLKVGLGYPAGYIYECVVRGRYLTFRVRNMALCSCLQEFDVLECSAALAAEENIAMHLVPVPALSSTTSVIERQLSASGGCSLH